MIHTVWQTIAVAFSMFSRIPMPRVAWNGRTLRYSLCAFPLVGAAVGAVCAGWGLFCAAFLPENGLLAAAGLALLPVAVTGGIHLDGLADTADALASHAPREKKLAILKDPHMGAFGALALCCVLLWNFALCTALPLESRPLLQYALGFVLSRALSGLAVAGFPCAKGSGLAHKFAAAADKTRVRCALAVVAMLCSAALVAVHPLCGALQAAGAWGMFLFYHHLSKREFGGITGDLAGWFLQLCESVEGTCLVLSWQLLGI